MGGISVTELNNLEREFLAMIDWRLMVSPSRRVKSVVVVTIVSTFTQTTREVLQEYYVNLVRTHSSNIFYIAGNESPGTSSDSDLEMDSAPSSPILTRQPHMRLSPAEPAAVLVEPGATLQETHQRPTIEQNMAFAALQQFQDTSTLSSIEKTNKRA